MTGWFLAAKRSRRILRRFVPNGRRNSDCRKAFRSRLGNSTFITVQLPAESKKVYWLKPSELPPRMPATEPPETTQGVEIVGGDLLDFRAVRRAFDGTQRAYFVFPIRPGIVQATAHFAQAALEAKAEFIVNMSRWSHLKANSIRPKKYGRGLSNRM